MLLTKIWRGRPAKLWGSWVRVQIVRKEAHMVPVGDVFTVGISKELLDVGAAVTLDPRHLGRRIIDKASSNFDGRSLPQLST